MLNKLCTWMAKSAPYPPCTVTAFWPRWRGVPVLCPVLASGNTTSPYCRAVSTNTCKKLASRRPLLNFNIIRYVSNLYQYVAFAPSLSVNPEQHNYIPASLIDLVASQLYKMTFHNRTRANGLSINIS